MSLVCELVIQPDDQLKEDDLVLWDWIDPGLCPDPQDPWDPQGVCLCSLSSLDYSLILYHDDYSMTRITEFIRPNDSDSIRA